MRCVVIGIEGQTVQCKTDDLHELSLPRVLFSQNPQENDVVYVEVKTEKELQEKKDFDAKELLNELLDGS